MRGIKKFLYGIWTVWLALCFFATAGQAAEADGRAYLESAYQEMKGLTGFRGSMAMDVKSPLFVFSAMTEFAFCQGEEWTLKAETESFVSVWGGESQVKKSREYAQGKPGEILYYVNNGRGWLKSAFPNEKAASGSGLAAAAKVLKEVTARDENEELIVLEALIDMEKVSEIAATALALQEESAGKKADGKAKEMQALYLKAIRHMGDVPYVVTIDKASNCIVNIMIDMTPALKKSYASVLADTRLSEEQKAAAGIIMEDMQALIQEDFSDFGKVKPFSVPEDVVQNAADVKTYKQGLREKAGRIS